MNLNEKVHNVEYGFATYREKRIKRRIFDVAMWYPYANRDDEMICHELRENERNNVLERIVIGIFEIIARLGKHTSGRLSASTQVQESDHSQALDPGADKEVFQEQPLQHTPVVERIVNTRDARSLIELNQYKYTNVPVAEEHMANLTSDELAEAIRLYRQEQTWLQEEAELEEEPEEEPEESGDSQQSKRSVFDRIGAKGKKSKKDQGNKKEAEATKQKRLEELREQIRKEEEAKLELKI
ncbi:hypothetical protein AgCh_005414 [Apium graveolens]